MPFPSLNPALERALLAQGYAEPTPVQAAVLEAPADQDLLVSAQTGSGKTVAYGLAAAPNLLGDAEKLPPPAAPLALVIAPTRELAMQVARELGWLYGETGARVITCVGGMDPRAEQRALNAGAHIVVGTPGRLKDHLERGNIDLSALSIVVLDEADEMLDLGFREELETILEGSPPERRTLLFSATIARDIAVLAKRYQRDALRIDVSGGKNEPHGDIEYRAIRVSSHEVEHAVVNILRAFEAPGALVFCATREAVRHLASNLRERGFSAVALSGELTQKDRTDALHALRTGQARVCVATDVAARGLDLPDLGLVIHAELPANRQSLLHRSGRTGRAGRKGTSILLVPTPRRRRAEQLIESAGVEATWSGPPTADEIRAADQARLLNDPTFTEPMTDEDLVLAAAVMAGRTPEEVAVALIRMHRARLPAPEEISDDTAREAAREARERDRPAVRRAAERDGYDPAARPGRSERGDRPERLARISGGSWFRLTIGRSKNADPKWLIPVICRLGNVTKKDIGQIKVFDRETKFEISAEAEPAFREAVRGAREGEIAIEPATPPGARQDGPREDRPREDRPRDDRPPREPPRHEPRSEGYRAEGPRREARADGPRPERTRPAGPPRDRAERPDRKPYAPKAPRPERAAAPVDSPPAAPAPQDGATFVRTPKPKRAPGQGAFARGGAYSPLGDESPRRVSTKPDKPKAKKKKKSNDARRK